MATALGMQASSGTGSMWRGPGPWRMAAVGLPCALTCTRACRCGEPDLVARDRRRLAGGGEKGGAQVARTLRGTPGSRYHLAVDANGAPLAVRLAAGNENERRHLLPLLDMLLARGIHAARVVGRPRLRQRELREHYANARIEPRISQRRRKATPSPAARLTIVWRGQQTPTENTRPPRPASAGRRTHQRQADTARVMILRTRHGTDQGRRLRGAPPGRGSRARDGHRRARAALRRGDRRPEGEGDPQPHVDGLPGRADDPGGHPQRRRRAFRASRTSRSS